MWFWHCSLLHYKSVFQFIVCWVQQKLGETKQNYERLSTRWAPTGYKLYMELKPPQMALYMGNWGYKPYL